MNAVNLIPPAILQRHHRQRVIFAWATSAAIVFLASSALVLLAQQQQKKTIEDPDLAPELVKLQHEVAKAQMQEEAVVRQIAQTHRQVRAARVVSGQPDWQGLLDVIAHRMGDAAVVTQFQFGPASSPAVAQAAGLSGAAGNGIWLVIGGVAEEHHEVPGLVLRLEELGLFEQVTLVETQRALFEGSERIAFRIRCKID